MSLQLNPTDNVTSDGKCTAFGAPMTLTTALADNPLSVFAITVVVPSVIPLIKPLLLTVATFSFSEIHSTDAEAPNGV